MNPVIGVNMITILSVYFCPAQSGFRILFQRNGRGHFLSSFCIGMQAIQMEPGFQSAVLIFANCFKINNTVCLRRVSDPGIDLNAQ